MKDRDKLRTLLIRALPVIALLIVLVPEIAFARAGGGEGYSGRSSGSGRSGSGSGGGGDGGAILYLIIRLFELCIYHPAVGIPILLIVVGFFVYAYRSGSSAHTASVIRRGNEAMARQRAPKVVNAVRDHDPDFVPSEFTDRVRIAFVSIQDAWSQQNLASVRPFISDAVYERFSLQFDEQKALGWRNKMSGVSVQSAALVDTRSDNLFDELDVRIEARAIDQKVTLDTGKVVEGSGQPEAFAEVWTFLRRRGAKSLSNKPGLMEGHCPNCGAALEMNQSANCQYCGALLRSGQYDWVLVEITQECEWEPRQRHGIPGAAALAAHDPQFNTQELEDRASVVFWRYCAATRTNSIQPLRKVASESFCTGFEVTTTASANAARSYFGQCAVGSVDVRAVRTLEGRDQALVEVRWSGWRFGVRPGQKPEKLEQSAVLRSLLVLSRKSNAKSNADRAVASAHCPTCGAPESGGTASACEYCGTVLNDGSAGWVLDVWEPANSPAGTALLEVFSEVLDEESVESSDGVVPAAAPPATWAAARQVSGQRTLTWMVKMAITDGHVDPAERKMLTSAARRYGVSPDRLEGLLNAATTGQLELPDPADENEARSHLSAMARTALADGKLSGDEDRLLRTAGQKLGLSDHDVRMLIKRTEAEIFAEAKAALAAERRAQRH